MRKGRRICLKESREREKRKEKRRKSEAREAHETEFRGRLRLA